jgi:LAS superfamily LD-carboxypeptidase LdcB
MSLRTLGLAVCVAALAACGAGTPAAANPQPAPPATPAAPPATPTTPAPQPPPPIPPSKTPAPPATDHAPAIAPAPKEEEKTSADALLGKVDPAKDPRFAKIPAKYLGGSRVYGDKEAVAALAKMIDAAGKDGIDIKIVSAFRSFDDQKSIWEKKWTGKTLVEGGKLPKTAPDPKARALKIMEFSAMPGASRHHWGTDFDLNSLDNKYFASGKGRRVYDWLTAHAADYGFCQVYSAKGADRPNGYSEEKWHWSFLAVATRYLKQYPDAVTYEKITGFLGSDTAKEIGVIPNYVQGINPKCQR